MNIFIYVYIHLYIYIYVHSSHFMLFMSFMLCHSCRSCRAKDSHARPTGIVAMVPAASVARISGSVSDVFQEVFGKFFGSLSGYQSLFLLLGSRRLIDRSLHYTQHRYSWPWYVSKKINNI